MISHEDMQHNKELMLEKIRYHEIKSVCVTFSGSNDSGDLHVAKLEPLSEDEADLFGNTLETVLVPEAKMPTRYEYNKDESVLRDWKKKPATLKEVIEEVCYYELELAHGGWEINDGSYGTITIEPLAKFHDRDRIHFDVNYYAPDDYDYDDDEYNDE